jgi:uncharacterized protein DUF4136
MKIKKPLFVLIPLLLCLSSAASSFAIDVKTDFDRGTDFGRYKTFCWQKVETRNPLWIDRIKAAVNAALTAKGWSQAESSSACDVALVAMEIKRDHDTVDTFYNNLGGGWGWRGFGGGGFGEATTTRTHTRPVRLSLICSTQKPRIWSGEDQLLTRFPTTPTRI